MPRDDEYDARDDRADVVGSARDKVFAPALALIIAAALGLVGGLGLVGFAVVFALFMDTVADQMEQQQQAMVQQQIQAQKAAFPGGPAPAPPPAPPPGLFKTMFRMYGAIYGIWGAILFALSVVILIGAIRMKTLGSYGWAMTGTVTAIASVVTCNLPAMGFGIWALVVLMQPDVKEAFERVADPGPRRRFDREEDDEWR
jgi:hypothetical protein